MVSIPACHAGDRGSISRRGDTTLWIQDDCLLVTLLLAMSMLVGGVRGGCSSNGRALALHVRSTGIDTPHLQCLMKFGVSDRSSLVLWTWKFAFINVKINPPYPLGHTNLIERARTPFISSKCSQRSPFFKQDHQALVLWCNWSALRTLNPVILVQVSVEPISGVVSISNL